MNPKPQTHGQPTASASMSERVSHVAGDASELLREGYDAAAEQARQTYDDSLRTVSRHPLESVGAALGFGMILGVIIGISIGSQRERELTWRERFMRPTR